MNTLSATTQSVLLLCGRFGEDRAESADAKPLTPGEYDQVAKWLQETGINPAQLVNDDANRILADFPESKVTRERILKLLQRGTALALTLERWSQRGIWVISRGDPDYPRRLKHRLGRKCPPLLYGAGHKSLMTGGGFAIVGSRDADEDSLVFTKNFAQRCAREGQRVISGGAKGVDSTAMLAALEAGGKVVGILADSLERTLGSKQYRQAVMEGRLLLISACLPNARFNVGNAMGRNKYIYTLADAAVVIRCGVKGGTLNGAEENLKYGWVPLFVRPVDDPDTANQNLIAAGGTAFNEALLSSTNNLSDLLVATQPASNHNHIEPANPAADSASVIKAEEKNNIPINQIPESFSETISPSNEGKESSIVNVEEAAIPESGDNLQMPEVEQPSHTASTSQQSIAEIKKSVLPDDGDTFLYERFLEGFKHYVPEGEGTEKQVADHFAMPRNKVRDWLRRAVEEGKVQKLSRPVRYRISADLFSGSSL